MKDELHIWMDKYSCRPDGFSCTRYEHGYFDILLLHRARDNSGIIYYIKSYTKTNTYFSKIFTNLCGLNLCKII